MSRPIAVLLLVITTMLWGFAFVAQKTAMDAMGPLTFSAVRYLLGGLVILPLAAWEWRRSTIVVTARQWRQVALLCVVFFFGVYLQQAGLTMTTATNAGFLTSLYVLFVPLLALAAFRQKPNAIVWVCMPMALCGVFLLNGGRLDHLNFGDLLVLGCAVCWAVQLLMIGQLSRDTGLPVTISALCFLATAIFAAIGGFAVENPSLAGIGAGWVEILYSGILSTAVAFTLQAVAQQHVPAANAAIVLSAEGLFAALGAALLLGERLPPIGYLGAVLIFAAIVLVEAVPALTRRQRLA